MAHRSQCSSAGDNPLDPNYLPPHYREEYRLAIDALIEADLEGYYGFLQDANVVDFLSRPEIEYIKCTVQVPCQRLQPDRRYVVGDGDGSSDTYWPIHSDLDAPGLDLGWPQQHRFVGPTEITTLVNPPDPEMPSIKEQVRRMIKNAQQVVAVAMDMFTDVDIFADILNAAMRNVAVYILLDELNAHHFVAMVNNCRVNLDEIKFLRVRTVSGSTYYCHTGKSFKGQMMNRFILVDSKIVLSGNYSFMWSFEKIHRCIAHVFVGQFVATFDEEFRILFAQSEPLVMENAVPYVQDYGNLPQRHNIENPNIFMKEHLPIENLRAEWPGRSFEDPMKVQPNLFSFRRGESIHSSTDEHLPISVHATQQIRGEHPFLDQRTLMQGPNKDTGGFRRQGYTGVPNYPQMNTGNRGEQNIEGLEMQGTHLAREQYFSQRAGPEPGYEIYRKPRDYSYPQLDQYSGSDFAHEMDDVEPPGGYDHVQRFLHSYPTVEKVPTGNLLVPVQSPPRRHSMGQSFPCQTSPTQPNLPEQKHFFNVHHKRQDQKEGLRDWRISSYLTALQHSGLEDMDDLQRSDSFDSTPYDMQKTLVRPCESEMLNVQTLDNLSLPEKSLDLQAGFRSFLASNAKQTPATTSESSGNTEGDKPEEHKEMNLTREESFRRRPNLALQRSSRLRHSLIFSSNLEQHTTEDTKSSLSQSSEDDPLKKSAVVSNILEKKKPGTREPFQWSSLVKPPCDPSLDSALKTESEEIPNKTKEESAGDKGETSEIAQKYSQMEKGLSQRLEPQLTENTQIQTKPSALKQSVSFLDMNDPDCRLRFFKELAAKRKAELAQAKDKVSKEPENSNNSLPVDRNKETEPVSEKKTSAQATTTMLSISSQKCPVGTSHELNTKVPSTEVLTDENPKLKSHNSKMTEEHGSLKSDSSCRAIPTSATDAEKIKLKQQLSEEHDSQNTVDDNSASVANPVLLLGQHTRSKLLSQLRPIPNISSSEFSRSKFSFPSILRQKHSKLSPTDPTALQMVPSTNISGLSQQTPAVVMGPSQQTPAADTGPSQHSPAVEKGPSLQIPSADSSCSQSTPVVKTGLSKQIPAAETISSQQISATETDPSKQIPAAETGPSKQTAVAETGPSHQIPVADKDTTQQSPTPGMDQSLQIPAAETVSSQQIPAAETDPSKQICAADTGPSKQSAVAETGPSHQIPAADQDPSKQIFLAETGPSQHIPAADKDPTQQTPTPGMDQSLQIPAAKKIPSQQFFAAETGASQQIPVAETGASQQIPVAETGASQQIPVAETGASQQIPAAETDPSQQTSVAEIGPSQQICTAGTDPSQQIPTAGTDPSQQIPAAETDPSNQILAAETGPSLKIPAAETGPSQQLTTAEANLFQKICPAETGPSQYIPTAETDISQEVTAAKTGPSQQIPAADTEPSQQIPAADTGPSQQIPAAETCPSQQIPAAQTGPSQQIPAAETGPSQQIPAAQTGPSQQIPAAQTGPSQQIPAAELDPSQQTPAAETSLSQQTPAAETSLSQHTSAAETGPSRHIPAAETCPSQYVPAADTGPSQQIVTAEVGLCIQTPAAETCPSQYVPAADTGPSQQIVTAEVGLCIQTPAAETDPSQQTPAAEKDPSKPTPAAEKEHSQQIPASHPISVDIKTELDSTNRTSPTTAFPKDLLAKQHSVNTASTTVCPPPQTSSGVSFVPTEEKEQATSTLVADKSSERMASDLTLSSLNTSSSEINWPDSNLPSECDLFENATAITVASSAQTDTTPLTSDSPSEAGSCSNMESCHSLLETSSLTNIAKTDVGITPNVSLTNTGSLMKHAKPDVYTNSTLSECSSTANPTQSNSIPQPGEASTESVCSLIKDPGPLMNPFSVTDSVSCSSGDKSQSTNLQVTETQTPQDISCPPDPKEESEDDDQDVEPTKHETQHREASVASMSGVPAEAPPEAQTDGTIGGSTNAEHSQGAQKSQAPAPEKPTHQASTISVLSCSNLRDDTKVLLEQISAKNQGRTSKMSLAASDIKEGEADGNTKKDKQISGYLQSRTKTWSARASPEERENLLKKMESMRKERRVYSRFEAP